MGQLSNRFLSAADTTRRGTPRPEPGRLKGATQLFAEGQWQVIRVQLEHDGWNPSQIDLLHEQLRQGWPLTIAKQHVARLSGHCPLQSRSDQRCL